MVVIDKMKEIFILLLLSTSLVKPTIAQHKVIVNITLDSSFVRYHIFAQSNGIIGSHVFISPDTSFVFYIKDTTFAKYITFDITGYNKRDKPHHYNPYYFDLHLDTSSPFLK